MPGWLPLPPFPELDPPIFQRKLTQDEIESYIALEESTLSLPPSTLVCIGEVIAPIVSPSSGAPCSVAQVATGQAEGGFARVSLELELKTLEETNTSRTYGEKHVVHVVYNEQRFAILEQSKCDIAIYLAPNVKFVTAISASPINDNNMVCCLAN